MLVATVTIVVGLGVSSLAKNSASSSWDMASGPTVAWAFMAEIAVDMIRSASAWPMGPSGISMPKLSGIVFRRSLSAWAGSSVSIDNVSSPPKAQIGFGQSTRWEARQKMPTTSKIAPRPIVDDLEFRGESGVMEEEDSFGLMRQDMSRQLGFYLSAGRKQVCLRLKGL